MYVVDIGFGEYVEFETLKDAQDFCNEVAQKTKIILSISPQSISFTAGIERNESK